MKTLMIVLLGGALLSGCSTVPESVSSKIPFMGGAEDATASNVEVLTRGHDFINLEPREFVFSSASQVAQWARNGTAVSADVAAAARDIDFQRHHLIFVAAGMKPHAGYDLALGEGLRQAGSFASLGLRLEQPAPGTHFSPKLASPYLLLKVPAAEYRRISVQYEACDQTQLLLVSR